MIGAPFESHLTREGIKQTLKPAARFARMLTHHIERLVTKWLFIFFSLRSIRGLGFDIRVRAKSGIAVKRSRRMSIDRPLACVERPASEYKIAKAESENLNFRLIS